MGDIENDKTQKVEVGLRGVGEGESINWEEKKISMKINYLLSRAKISLHYYS